MSEPKIIWSGPSWRLVSRELELGNGKTIEKVVLDHPGSVTLVPIFAGKVLMLRQYRIALQQEILELPAGTRNPGEEWLLCAQRECREETGYRAEKLTPLGEIWPAPGVTNERMAIFLAEKLIPDPLPQDEDEMIEVTPMSLAKLVEMALDGRIQDAKSVVAILRAARYFDI